MDKVKETGRNFRGDMVRAIIAGDKNMTRRIMDPQPAPGSEDPMMTVFKGKFGAVSHEPFQTFPDGGVGFNSIFFKSPWGGPGDRVWVRENYRADSQCDAVKPSELSRGEPILYEADRMVRTTGCMMIEPGKSRPSIFMPRWASRITLEIVSVRVERLQNIHSADALAEGITNLSDEWQISYGIAGSISAQHPVRAFQLLWQSINGPSSWIRDPWVWVISFKVVEVRS